MRKQSDDDAPTEVGALELSGDVESFLSDDDGGGSAPELPPIPVVEPKPAETRPNKKTIVVAAVPAPVPTPQMSAAVTAPVASSTAVPLAVPTGVAGPTAVTHGTPAKPMPAAETKPAKAVAAEAKAAEAKPAEAKPAEAKPAKAAEAKPAGLPGVEAKRTLIGVPSLGAGLPSQIPGMDIINPVLPGIAAAAEVRTAAGQARQASDDPEEPTGVRLAMPLQAPKESARERAAASASAVAARPAAAPPARHGSGEGVQAVDPDTLDEFVAAARARQKRTAILVLGVVAIAAVVAVIFLSRGKKSRPINAGPEPGALASGGDQVGGGSGGEGVGGPGGMRVGGEPTGGPGVASSPVAGGEPSSSPEPSASANALTSPEPVASPEPSLSASPAPSVTASPEPSVTASPSPAVSVPPSPSPTPVATQSPKPSPTQSPKPSPTQSPKPSPTQSPKPSPTQSPKPSPSQSPKPSPSASADPDKRPRGGTSTAGDSKGDLVKQGQAALRSGNTGEAEAAFFKASTSSDRRLAAGGSLGLADIALRRQNYREAVRQARRAAAMGASGSRSWTIAADAQCALGDAAAANESYGKAGSSKRCN